MVSSSDSGLSSSDSSIGQELTAVALELLPKNPQHTLTASIFERTQLHSKLTEIGLFHSHTLNPSHITTHVNPDHTKLPASLSTNDIERESLFISIATTAAERALVKIAQDSSKKISELRRPNDYFAEMVKSDVHMKKVRESLLEQEKRIVNAQKRRSERDGMRKGGKNSKSVQKLNAQEKRHEVNKEIEKIESVRKERVVLADRKKRRAGFGMDDIEVDDEFPTELLDVEEIPGSARMVRNGGMLKRESKSESKTTMGNKKRQARDERYGFGGVKRGSKRNTKESNDDVNDGFRGNRNGKSTRNKSGRVFKKTVGKKRR